MSITIYHNARCSNSRGALALILDAGFSPTVIDYLQNPPSVAELKVLVKACGLPVRELMRSKEAIYSEMNLGDPALSEDALIAAIHAHPVLLNRPIVVSPRGTRLCRPPELVRELLP